MRPPAAAAAAQPRSYKPAPLRLDAEGREVDEHGVPVVRKQAVTELKVSTIDERAEQCNVGSQQPKLIQLLEAYSTETDLVMLMTSVSDHVQCGMFGGASRQAFPRRFGALMLCRTYTSAYSGPFARKLT